MKYRLTEVNIEWMGKKLFQIEAVVSFGSVLKGEKGGYIEKEGNLAQVCGDAWVYGNALVCGDAQVCGDARVYGKAQVCGDARVSGNAWVYGNAQVCGDARVSPINVTGLLWDITIMDKHIHIGCEFHTAEEWFKLKDSQIKAMHTDALPWWKENKEVIRLLWENHARKEQANG